MEYICTMLMLKYFRNLRLERWALLAFLCVATGSNAGISKYRNVFADFPNDGLSQVPCFPTPNHSLTSGSAVNFAAHTEANPKYGLPGMTRDFGTQIHHGVDIVPVKYVKTSKTIQISYVDPKTRKSYNRNEPILVPKDEIYSILDGVVVVANQDQSKSGYGKYVMVEYHFKNGAPFVSLYAHMNQVDVKVGQQVRRGEQIGWMGTTSKSAGGRRYLSFVPHCHFEVGKMINPRFSTTLDGKRMFPHLIGGNYDPRNIQPYNPVDFLLRYHAKSHESLNLGDMSVSVGLRAR